MKVLTHKGKGGEGCRHSSKVMICFKKFTFDFVSRIINGGLCSMVMSENFYLGPFVLIQTLIQAQLKFVVISSFLG